MISFILNLVQIHQELEKNKHKVSLNLICLLAIIKSGFDFILFKSTSGYSVKSTDLMP